MVSKNTHCRQPGVVLYVTIMMPNLPTYKRKVKQIDRKRGGTLLPPRLQIWKRSGHQSLIKIVHRILIESITTKGRLTYKKHSLRTFWMQDQVPILYWGLIEKFCPSFSGFPFSLDPVHFFLSCFFHLCPLITTKCLLLFTVVRNNQHVKGFTQSPPLMTSSVRHNLYCLTE